MILSNLRQRVSAAFVRIFGYARGVSTASISPDELEAALASLSEPSRTVFLLHARDQLPLDEVAQQLELPLPDIERHLVFALVALDRQIGAISPADPVAPCPVDR